MNDENIKLLIQYSAAIITATITYAFIILVCQ